MKAASKKTGPEQAGTLKIVADENIVAVEDLFRQHGDLQLLPGRQICAADVRDADVLLVRSITRVDRALLEGSRVRFVATATSGTDHLDLGYLRAAGIGVAEAAGSNANAVVEYCLSGIAELICRGGFSLRGRRAAIIGFGHVGRGLYRRLRELGVDCVVCDPFVAQLVERQGAGDVHFCDLETALSASLISLHTPLSRDGEHPTWHLVNEERLDMLAPGTLLINASRGEVVDNAALCRRLGRSNDLLTLWDVWENEPEISRDLLGLVGLGTPHIAGYSVEAKRSASERNYEAFLQYFKLPTNSDSNSVAEPRTRLEVRLEEMPRSGVSNPDERVWAECLRAAFGVSAVDQRLRSTAAANGAAVFDSIRKTLSARREFSHYTLDQCLLEKGLLTPAVATRLTALGFSFSRV
ncbi:MAG: 4-phosphoerythronate dehydrogenase [Gammaproteobacteria bacterium]|nr:4-phosphoerythronate dehydrogenase [Gammaproteobacteria bacterium]